MEDDDEAVFFNSSEEDDESAALLNDRKHFRELRESKVDHIDGNAYGQQSQRPVIGLLGATVLSYFTVSGGPFGLEVAIAAGGPANTLCTLLAFTVFSALPSALMTAELSSALPGRGGFSYWVERGISPRVGALVNWISLINTAVDSSAYPGVAWDYLAFGRHRLSATDTNAYMESWVLRRSAAAEAWADDVGARVAPTLVPQLFVELRATPNRTVWTGFFQKLLHCAPDVPVAKRPPGWFRVGSHRVAQAKCSPCKRVAPRATRALRSACGMPMGPSQTTAGARGDQRSREQ